MSGNCGVVVEWRDFWGKTTILFKVSSLFPDENLSELNYSQ